MEVNSSEIMHVLLKIFFLQNNGFWIKIVMKGVYLPTCLYLSVYLRENKRSSAYVYWHMNSELTTFYVKLYF